MKISDQCTIAASKGNQIIGLFGRNIVYKGKELIILMYTAIASSHLEYCIQARRPYRKKDIDMLEKIQWRATKVIPKLRVIRCEMRLKERALTTLTDQKI